ncbi:hypothetical protein JDW21_18925 [Bacillus subtilis]|uniref:Uncharacterized protein n=1 Tax=Bacillus phage vB_BsuS_PJN02 TaxID=2920374 RepID=A0AC61TSN1_9CAUD|nr:MULTISPECIES: hypothetical protein [Bacillus subtilis group]YP_010681815.1 hypothetical protein PQE76_gp197 [Bacillus phage vB_BsuS_PJN02]MCR4362118.1 hypothetical protein [Bacillus subtilis]UNH58540.1 hypothetical protein [Bacillus phage vB_BsuS_PJN02]UQB84276.1 hypothetical protein KMZ31_20395 [Bacillus amyloliquefaciens]WOF32903.1 hypothetical protein OEJ84_23680 [Bacillus subtilis]
MKKFAQKEYLFFSLMGLVALVSLLITDRLFFLILIAGILINTYYCGYTKKKVIANLVIVLLLVMAQISWSFEM